MSNDQATPLMCRGPADVLSKMILPTVVILGTLWTIMSSISDNSAQLARVEARQEIVMAHLERIENRLTVAESTVTADRAWGAEISELKSEEKMQAQSLIEIMQMLRDHEAETKKMLPLGKRSGLETWSPEN